MTIKYVLHTGETKDAEGNTIRIDGDKLARLYGVPISECLIMAPDEADALRELVPANATHLHFREDGEYPQNF